jgi:hypothetical protein
MLIDCDTCAVRGAACGGCVVATLFGLPPEVQRLDAVEAAAIETLARAGFEVTVLAEAAPAAPRAVRSRRWQAA